MIIGKNSLIAFYLLCVVLGSWQMTPWGRKMHIKKTMTLTFIAASAFVFSASGAALAWGCSADSDGISYGYSTKYSNRNDAVSRALEECRKKGGRNCKIKYCRESD
jgi:hypothetical protein